jgi:KDO2-lipid IV(A) lauroyltransferase
MSESWNERAAFLGTSVVLTIACLAVEILPRRWLYRFTDMLARLGFYFLRGFRTRSLRNVRLTIGNAWNGMAAEEIVRRSLRNFFRDFVEIVNALVVPAEQLRLEIPIEGREHLDAARAKGKGVIALGAHLGNFFLIGTRLAAEGYSTNFLVNQPRNGQFAKFSHRYRSQVRQKNIHARPRAEALRELHQVLRRNEVAVIVADEYRRGSGVLVPLFGRTVMARRGPAMLALRTGAAVVPVCLVRDQKGTLKLIIEPELELLRTHKGKTDIRENTLRMTQWLEKTVRTYADQWNWMNIHWQDDIESRLVTQDQHVRRLTY